MARLWAIISKQALPNPAWPLATRARLPESWSEFLVDSIPSPMQSGQSEKKPDPANCALKGDLDQIDDPQRQKMPRHFSHPTRQRSLNTHLRLRTNQQLINPLRAHSAPSGGTLLHKPIHMPFAPGSHASASPPSPLISACRALLSRKKKGAV